MTEALKTLSADLAELVANAADSVQQVDARRRLPATGIAWAEDLVVTAHHVVENDEDITIGSANGDRQDARLVGRDPRNDLALLRVEGGLTPANWAADNSLRVGNLALAVARPRRIRASAGIVSGIIQAQAARRPMRRRMAKGQMKKGKRLHRQHDKWRRRMREWGGFALADGLLQLDLIMYPGFSGGALLGADGGVHGLLTSGFGGGIGIAVPVSTLRRSVAALLTDGKIRSGYIGVGVQAAQLPDALIETLEQATGLLVVSVAADSPAAAAGMLVGDILVALDKEAIADMDELQVALARLKVGAAVEMAFVRGGELREGSVVIGAR
ncbi:MAG: S1C family serine protease [Chloroflexi bacterium]|nr:S1C family serine protease [Chloroflexota bacterium]MCY4246462.1 S1C family serine protease [Chloroflexota bacterium]